MFHTILSFIFIFLIIKFVVYGIKYNTLFYKKYYNQLKIECKVNNYYDFLFYIKELNPWGTFETPKRMKENLLKNNNSKDIELIVEEIVLIHKEIIKRFIAIIDS